MSEKIFDPCLACDVCKDDCTYQLKQEENKKLKAQIEKMKCRENCGNDFEINNNTSCPLYDFQNVRCTCDKWEMMK